MELDDEWVPNGFHEFTHSDNMKPVPQLLIDWVLTVQKAPPNEMMASLIKKRALTLS